MTGKATRLKWGTGRWQTETGSADKIALFTIHYKSQRDDPSWFMRTELPGLQHQTWKDESKDELKDTAERVLDAWLTRIGAFL